MKRLLLFLIPFILASCYDPDGNTYVSCPCVVTKVSHFPPNRYEVTVTGREPGAWRDEGDFKSFTFRTKFLPTVGDTLLR